jgi:hypothetical protein
MAVEGKFQVIENLRAAKLVYWRIFESTGQKSSGAFLATADFENPDLLEKDSYADLQSALNRLSRGRYIMTAYRTNSTKGGAAYDTSIELEGTGSSSAISGINDPATFYLEGIGKVTPENFEEAIDKKLSIKLALMDKEKEYRALRDRVKQLEAEAKDNEGMVNRGLMAVGTVLYGQLSKTPQFKEMIGMVADVTKAAATGSNQQQAQFLGGPNEQDKAPLPDNHVEGDSAEIGGVKVNQDELFGTLDELGKDNPDVLDHLKILANLKKNNPAMYAEAVDMAKAL